MTSIDISFITINYNSSNLTISLVDSIIKQTSKNMKYEIIIIDNGSNIDDFKNLKEKLKNPEITIIRNRVNSGFASGNMLGVNYASGNYYFFINNDCIFINDAASIMMDYACKNNKIAILTASIVDANNNSSSTHKLFPSVVKELLGNSIAGKLKNIPSNKQTLTNATSVEVVSGSCMFFRADVFCEIGGFDTTFFLYCEEEDICKRVIDNGYKIVVLPQVKIYHKSGGSTQKSFQIKREYYISYSMLLDKHFCLLSRTILFTVLYFKLFRRCFRSKDDLKIFLFALRKFSTKYSLRHSQKVAFNPK